MELFQTGHGAKGLFQCKDGYTLLGNNMTECVYGDYHNYHHNRYHHHTLCCDDHLWRVTSATKYFTFRDESGLARIEIEIMDICKKVSQLLSTSNWIILATRILLPLVMIIMIIWWSYDDSHDDDVEQSHQGLKPQAIGLGRCHPAKRCIVRSLGLWHTARYFSWATWGSTIIGFTSLWLHNADYLMTGGSMIIGFTSSWLHNADYLMTGHMWGRSRMTDR